MRLIHVKTLELIELLKKCDSDEEVTFEMSSGCCGDYEYMDVTDTRINEYGNSKSISITFAPLPGYKSCIQAGGTIQNDRKYWEKK